MRIAILLFLMITVVTTAQAQLQKGVVDKVIAVIGDKIILQSDIKNYKDDAERLGNPLPEDVDCMLIEQAMTSKILMLQAEKDSLPVTDEDVEAHLARLLYHFRNEIADQDIYKMKENARQPIRERMLAEAMQEKIVSHVKITPSEVQGYFERIPKDSLPFLESRFEIGQIIIYPKAAKGMERYEIGRTIVRLDSIRSKIIAGTVGFNEAAYKYSNENNSKFSSFILNKDGSPHVTIDQLDKELVVTLSKMKPGEYSLPVSFINEQQKEGVRIVYLKSRSEPHVMNLQNDYSEIAQLALQEKKAQVLDKWFKSKTSSYYIVVDNDTQTQCEEIKKYVSADVAHQ